MKVNTKIVAAALNIASLVLVLIFNPNSSTPLSLLPIFITATMWTVYDGGSFGKCRRFFLIMGLATGCLCMIIGLTCTVRACVCMTSRYMVVVNDGIAFLGNDSFDYLWFALFVLISGSSLYIGEIVTTAAKEKGQERASSSINAKMAAAMKKGD